MRNDKISFNSQHSSRFEPSAAPDGESVELGRHTVTWIATPRLPDAYVSSWLRVLKKSAFGRVFVSAFSSSGHLASASV
jgi:hypothetical protein